MELPTPVAIKAASMSTPQRNAVLERVAARVQQRLMSEEAAAYLEAAHAASLVPER